MDVKESIEELLNTKNIVALERGLVTLCCSEAGKPEPDRGWPSILLAVSALDAWATSPAEKARVESTIDNLLNSPELRNFVTQKTDQKSKDEQRLAFKKLLERRLRTLHVRGDGNCLFRSIVRIMFNGFKIPESYEDTFSLDLRKRCCRVTYDLLPDKMKGKMSREEWDSIQAGVEGSQDMGASGEWGDTTQLIKIAALLGLLPKVYQFKLLFLLSLWQINRDGSMDVEV